MQLLLSNYQPAKLSGIKEIRATFENLLKDSETLKIATGFISADSLIELKKAIEVNRRPKINLLIGMHFFDGFTKNQLQSAIELNRFLQEFELGFVNISDTVKFHGKMYSFVSNNDTKTCIVGSSNISSMFGRGRLYEADILINDRYEANSLDEKIEDLINKLGKGIEYFTTFKIIEENDLLEGHEDVEKINSSDLIGIWSKKGNYEFRIPIKTTPKSNLNIFFGKGRVANGYENPRAWYEVELIISKSITSLPNFPLKSTFEVVTTEGWKFKCNTSGDYSKNFRSSADLQILGKWLKGKLQQQGALKIGDLVTNETLVSYGKEYLTLSSTDNPNLWLIDFNPNASE